MKPDCRGMGLPISSCNFSTLKTNMLEWIRKRRCHTVMTMSFPMLAPYQQDADYHDAIDHSEVVLPDGMAVVWMSRWCGDPIRERLSGPDFFELFSQTASMYQMRYCLLGSTPEVLKAMRLRLLNEYPGITVSASISPPFGDWEEQVDRELVTAVNNSHADILWVGITAPRQEVWLHRQRNQLTVPVAVAIGAAFDFFAGTKKRAPNWMRRCGMEWLYRIMQEPLRMLPRYLRSLPTAVKILISCRRSFPGQKREP